MYKAIIRVHNLRAIKTEPTATVTLRESTFPRVVAACIPELMVLENVGRLDGHAVTVEYREERA